MPSDVQLKKAVSKFTESGLIRLSLNGDVIVERIRPVLQIGQATVCPPPGGFIQAISGAEHTMADLVVRHLCDSKTVADLFCGVGTFALRLAEHCAVLAIESDQPSLTALDEAWRGTGGKLFAVNVEKRDLTRRPLMASEMKKIEGVVFDPPRAGAEVQARQLAMSKVSRIAAISCNPVTLARDLRILIDAGYELDSVTPLDQFVYTPHVEVVALLQR